MPKERGEAGDDDGRKKDQTTIQRAMTNLIDPRPGDSAPHKRGPYRKNDQRREDFYSTHR